MVAGDANKIFNIAEKKGKTKKCRKRLRGIIQVMEFYWIIDSEGVSFRLNGKIRKGKREMDIKRVCFQNRRLNICSILVMVFLLTLPSNIWAAATGDGSTAAVSSDGSLFSGFITDGVGFSELSNIRMVRTAGTDPLATWEPCNSSQSRDIDFNAVAYGNDTFIAVGKSGTIVSSSNGMNWCSVGPGIAMDLYGVGYCNNTFVVVGDGGTILTSVDGVSWTSRTSGIVSKLYGVAYGNNTFVAVGDAGMVLTSPDGVYWTNRTSGTSQNLTAVTKGKDLFVAVGDSGKILTSPDGIIWTERTTMTNNIFYGVTYGNNIFMAVGYYQDPDGVAIIQIAKIFSSTDGVIWKDCSAEGCWLEDITYGNNNFVAVGSGNTQTIVTSADGLNWTERMPRANYSLSGVACGHNTFVAVGGGGTIFHSNRDATLLAITTGSLTAGFIGEHYSSSLLASGGTAPYTWRATGLPEGLSIDSQTGVISGTPAGIGTSNANVTVTDSLGMAVTQTFRLTLTQNTGIISTVAGNGTAGYSGDGGLAASALLNYPHGLAFDGNGNLYIADASNRRVRKIDSAGIITTVAGNGTSGYSGDGGSAIAAKITCPYGVAFDSNGNMYIADIFNHRIRKVDPAGIISTVAGNGVLTGSYKSGYSGDGGSATSAQLNYPYGVAFDASGNMYIADSNNHCIRKVDTLGIISTAAGNGTYGYSGDGGPATSAQLNNPNGLSFDNRGNMYIADTYNHRIRMVDPNGVISTVAGNGNSGDRYGNDGGYSGDGGLATSAQLNNPNGITFDSSGNMYIADSNNNCIRKVDHSGMISTFAGNGTSGHFGDGGPATSAQLRNPVGVALDNSGNLFIADYFDHSIRKVVLAAQQNSTISPTTGNFDKRISAQADVSTTMTLNGNELLRITNGETALIQGKDYNVNGNTVTIQKDYLASLTVGTTTLTFVFSSGASQVLTITITDGTTETWTNWTATTQKGSHDFWTIAFSKEVDPRSLDNNIYVTTDEAGSNKVDDISVILEGNLCQVKVMPPSNGWQPEGSYYLFISSKVKSQGGQELLSGIRMMFTITM